MIKEYRTSIIGKLKEWISFKRKDYSTTILYNNNFLKIYNDNFVNKVFFENLIEVKVNSNYEVTIIYNSHEYYCLKYIHKTEVLLVAEDILTYLQQYKRQKELKRLEQERQEKEEKEKRRQFSIIELFNENKQEIDRLYNLLKKVLNQQVFLSGRMISNLKQEACINEKWFSKLKNNYDKNILDGELTSQFDYILDIANNFPLAIKNSRENFIQFIEKDEKDFFNGLKPQQIRACIVNNDANLVIAGAGSGKTLVMLKRAAYMIKRGISHSSEIIILAYNRKAQRELKSRAVNMPYIEIYGHDKSNTNIATFHSLGKKIVQQVEQTRYKEVIGKSEQKQLVSEIILELIDKDSEYLRLILKYFNFYFYPFPNNSVKSINEYAQYMKSKSIKSANPNDEYPFATYDECVIANFLYFHNIEYTTVVPQRKASFFLKEHQIYICYKPNPLDAKFRSHINAGCYEIKGFRCFEISYKDCANPLAIEKLLKDNLENFGIKIQSLSANEIFEKIKQSKLINEFISMLLRFLSLYKNSEEGKLDFLEQKYAIEQTSSAKRIGVFIQIFRIVFKHYSKALVDLNKIDFDDMIYLSNKYVKEGKYISQYKYIMIDEFQDISYARAELIKNLLAQKEDSNLFCVGDDWQAIYRFSGSELKFVTEFKKEFAENKIKNYSETLLDYTFRFNDKILHTSSLFVTENKKQKEKEIKTIHFAKRPKVNIVLKNSVYTEDILFKILSKIAIREKKNKEVTVLILNRYNHYKNLKEGKEEIQKYFEQEVSKKFGLQVSFSTIHGAKGAEADYVILIDVKSGFKSFPSERESDEIIEMMLPKEENAIRYAEERRLMYVALTRAKKEMWIEADNNDISFFVEELKKDKFQTRILNLTNFQDKYGVLKKKLKCPICGDGDIIERSNLKGEVFYGCNNYPTCTYTLKSCLECNSNSSLFRESQTRYYCFNCKKRFKVCTECNDGIRTKHIFYKGEKKTGEKIYCSNYGNHSCRPLDSDTIHHPDRDVTFPVFESKK